MGNIKIINHQEVPACLQKKAVSFQWRQKNTWWVPGIPVRMRFSNFAVLWTTNSSNRVDISHHLDIISSGIYSKQLKLTKLKWKALITAVVWKYKIDRKKIFYLKNILWDGYHSLITKCGSSCFTQRTDVIRKNSLIFLLNVDGESRSGLRFFFLFNSCPFF